MKIAGLSNKSISFKSNYIEFNCIYANDSHGSLKNLPKLIAGVRQEQNNLKEKKLLTLMTGDDFAYENLYDEKIRDTRLSYISRLIGLIKPDFWTPGNHDFDNGKEVFAKLVEKANFKVVSTNLQEYDEHKNLREQGKLAKSFVIEKNGEKYGILGAFPVDDTHHRKNLGINDIVAGIEQKKNKEQSWLKDEDDNAFVERKYNKTLDLFQKELEKFKEQGVNKVILLSHLGYNFEKRVAKDPRAVGIDIIIGGHTHDEIYGIKTQESINKGIHLLQSKTDKPNLFYSASNEPIIITQAGGSSTHFGKLKVLFDKKGVIATGENGFPVDAKNELIETKNIVPDKKTQEKLRKQIDKAFKEYSTIGYLKEDVMPDFSRDKENTFVTYTLDGIKDLLNKNGQEVDITMSNSSLIRMGLEAGKQNEGSLSLPFTFDDRLIKTSMNAQQIVIAVKEMLEKGNKKGVPDILQLSSNVKYEIEKDENNKLKLTKLSINGEDLDINYKRKAGMYYADSKKPLDKVYNVVYRDFLLRGSLSKMLELKPDWVYEEVKTSDDKPLLISKGLYHYVRNFKTDKNGEIHLESEFQKPNIALKKASNRTLFAGASI